MTYLELVKLAETNYQFEIIFLSRSMLIKEVKEINEK